VYSLIGVGVEVRREGEGGGGAGLLYAVIINGLGRREVEINHRPSDLVGTSTLDTFNPNELSQRFERKGIITPSPLTTTTRRTFLTIS
jgi:hypothetical protein